MAKSIPFIRPLEVPDDLNELARLKREQGDQEEKWRRRFEWQFSGNPFRDPDHPLGWVIDTGEGRLGGHQMAMPQRFQCLGTERYIGISTDTFAHSDLRGKGMGRKLFQNYFDAQTGGLAVATTANVISEYIWMKAGAIYLGDLNIGYMYIFRSAPIVREVARWKAPKLTVPGWAFTLAGVPIDQLYKLRQPRPSAGVQRTAVAPLDGVLDELWEQYCHEYPITNIRDATFRRWRYAECPEPRPSLWIVTDPQSGLRASFALRETLRGQEQARACELLDVFGPRDEAAFQRKVLIEALAAARETGADYMHVAGGHPNWRRHLGGLGFLRRTLPSNQFLCKNMSDIPRSELSPAENWHLMPAVGDAAV